MIDQKQLRHFIHAIVADTMPDQQTAFEISVDRIIRSLHDGADLSNVSTTVKGSFPLSDFTSDDVMPFVKLITATFTLANTIVTMMRSKRKVLPETRELMKEWQHRLTEAGLPKHLVNTIVSKYGKDLPKLAKV